MFSAFGSKVNLLKEAAETTVVGDARPIPMAERTEMRHVHAGRTAGEVLDRLAHLVAERAPDIFPIFSVMYAARDGYPEIAELADTLDAQRLVGAGALARTVADRAGATDPGVVTELRDGIWTAMSLAPYEMLVVRRGWTIERYRRWVRAALQIPLDWA